MYLTVLYKAKATGDKVYRILTVRIVTVCVITGSV
jgi:hypothetical protein